MLLKNTIAILGCGWLGFPLAESLIKNGYDVNGSTTSEVKLKTLKKAGIAPFWISLSEDAIQGNIDDFLNDIQIIIINVPPRLRGRNTENYVKKMELLYGAISKSAVKKVVFVSSTSIYGDIDGLVTEETEPKPSTESGRQLILSEAVFQNDNKIETTIIRFGGLIGRERHPINMLSGKKGLSNGNHPINLIHLNDCIQIILSIIEKNWWNEVFNGVYPYHPMKSDYYTLKAKEKGLQVPGYTINTAKEGKTVSADKLISSKNYTFLKML